MTDPAPAASSGPYSRAFEAFVDGENDLLGMLAYALYKKAIQEARRAGRPAQPSEHRFPSDAEKAAYKSFAQGMLDTFAGSTLQQAQENILDRGIRPDLQTLKREITAHIDSRTDWKSAFQINILAWLASLAITALIALVATAPSWLGPLRQKLGL